MKALLECAINLNNSNKLKQFLSLQHDLNVSEGTTEGKIEKEEEYL